MDSKSKFLFSGKVKVKGEWKTKNRKWQTAKRRKFYLNAPPIYEYIAAILKIAKRSPCSGALQGGEGWG